MKNEILQKLLLLPLLLLTLLVVSCNVYEWYEDEPEPTPPEPETPAFLLHLNFDTDLPLYQEVNYSRAMNEPHDLRYQVMIYEGNSAITSASVPVKTLIFSRSLSDSPDYTLEIDLDEGSYSFLIWADYVNSGTMTDKYYTMSEMSAIVLSSRTNHSGSNLYRDAFRGQTTGTVVKGVGGEATAPMQRPMARFEFITTDLDKFMARVAAARGDDSKADAGDYVVTIVYTGFMPSTYNIYTDKPIDAWVGIKFDSELEPVSDGTRMGYDYVFVNGSESAVSVAVQVKDNRGNVVAATNSIDVPLVRSKLTVVKGEFMSSSSGGGTVIEPGFDGEFNIEIR